tara:strand:+ start:794 stop:964 length:171 start_codon:yes stop_codon:yes gene_type:complete
MSQPWDSEFRNKRAASKKDSVLKRVIKKSSTVLGAATMVGLVYIAVLRHAVKTAKQ